MSTLEDKIIPIKVSDDLTIYYKLTTVHRRPGNPEKCIWTIGYNEEENCFRKAVDEKWLEEQQGWGLKINIGAEGKLILEEVGLSEQQEPLKIAKFRDKNSTKEWHGYPADYRRRQQDKPSVTILADWQTKGIITKTQRSKISQCKKCNL